MKKQQKGFTIIEVMLVLAIAGLIFLMVFIALPALQRGQRDSQRRQDVSRFMSQVNSFSTNNRGDVPAEDATKMQAFLKDYMKQLDGEFKDPQTGEDYTVAFTGEPTTSKLIYKTSTKYDGEVFESGAGTRSVAIRIALEGSGTYCQDNQ